MSPRWRSTAADDLRTGERLNRVSDTEFTDDETGAKVLLQS